MTAARAQLSYIQLARRLSKYGEHGRCSYTSNCGYSTPLYTRGGHSKKKQMPNNLGNRRYAPMYPPPAGSFAAKWGGFAAHCEAASPPHVYICIGGEKSPVYEFKTENANLFTRYIGDQ
ncbi:hypothetical protein NQ317_009115 [Molorchus minor]|uniref:Uncharacterized protein n=1 Tax=Molorchus minor TaxID=1323400 RepID=A0ABQ9J046_9CUCU|nr:hypothetical protein NQ317_009115 [Molorchus minor]